MTANLTFNVLRLSIGLPSCVILNNWYYFLFSETNDGIALLYFKSQDMIPLIRFVNIILVALLAGVSIGIWIGFNPMKLSAHTYVEQQSMLHSLRILLVSLVITATIITILCAFIQMKNTPIFITLLLLVAAIFLIACILITRFGNKPIDDMVIK